MNEGKTAARLYIDMPLSEGATCPCAPAQAHYLLHVLRLDEGAAVLVFNGRDGEWRARLARTGRKSCELTAEVQQRPQSGGPAIHYLFAPLKHARLDYMVQKAVELGVASLRPVITRRTNVSRVNLDRMRANAIEAAEQCGVLRLPELCEPLRLNALLDAWDETMPLVFCDEDAPVAAPIEALSALPADGELALLIGPEGGFDDDERQRLKALPFVRVISLGPRIMRADTAAVAALALVNAVLFDWRGAEK